MDKQAGQQVLLQRLLRLADQSREQVGYAVELFGRERGVQFVSAALDVVSAAAVAVPEARVVLLSLYEYYDEAPVRRDAGVCAV